MQRIIKKFSAILFVFVLIALVTNSARGSDLTQNAEKALAIMAVPVGLVANANIQNAKAVSYIKLLDDVLVFGNCGFSMYNKSINDSRDLSYYKVLDAAYRVRDIAAQIRSIKNPTEAQQGNNQDLLKTVRALSLSLVQSAVRVHVAFNTVDTEEQRKIRYWCDAVAFLTNRLSDLTSNSTLSPEECEYQLAGIATGLLLLLAYAPERFQVQVAVERAREVAVEGAREVVRAGRRMLEDGGRAGRKVLEDGVERLKKADPAGGVLRVLRNGKRMYADLRDSLVA